MFFNYPKQLSLFEIMLNVFFFFSGKDEFLKILHSNLTQMSRYPQSIVMIALTLFYILNKILEVYNMIYLYNI